jgi:radical SAM superfamily enzyme YgiQ (UPF0313 family)
MCDVLLIHSPGPPSAFFLPIPPLGLGYISSVLEENGFDVKVIDLNVEHIKEDKFKKLVSSLNPKIVGISSTSLSIPFALQIAKIIKSEMDIPIVLGGAHARADPDFVFKFSNYFDYQIIGEGEITFLLLVKKLLNKKKIKKKVHIGIPVKNLDLIPFPSFHLFPMDKYVKSTAPMIISRGCPYACNFCTPHEKVVRFRSVKNVVDEIKLLNEKYDIHIIEFEDDNFTLNKTLVEKLCRKILKEKIEIEWSCQTRCDLINFSLLKLMKKAGCKFVYFGLESASEELQKTINKNLSLKTITSAINTSKKVGLKVGVSCLFGFPEEKEINIKQTLYYLHLLKPDFVFPSFLLPYPGTRIFESLVKKGKIEKDVWDKYAKRIRPLPVLHSENFPTFLYLFYFTRMISTNRISTSTPQLFSFLHFLKLSPPILQFIYANIKIFQYLKHIALNKIIETNFLREYKKSYQAK